ncbi:MAG: hypothetical protein D5R97_02545 [Candidatus Syntrophonatronum acetioxidans]|uniref:Uncharacterized protein n=1 Tax=Candidatus Syntrophonatronum acetioxidans TaxID=1795816 RepID=A0A424YH03_9FIRM|nr:MAG: hypothetical protein D5R97_02545 [Candidatus Syntrophonatronum acetioxidans]
MKKFTVRGKMHYSPDKEVEVTYHYTASDIEDGYLTGDINVVLIAQAIADSYNGPNKIPHTSPMTYISNNHYKNPLSMAYILGTKVFLEGTVSFFKLYQPAFSN